jgi:uncharacterized membrane protein
MMCCNYVHANYPCTVVFLILIIFWIYKNFRKIYAIIHTCFDLFSISLCLHGRRGSKICAFTMTQLYCCTRLSVI